ncbi:MAG: 5,6-dimethylbenzimidazole synthase, partial [Pseudolabrys sp.]
LVTRATAQGLDPLTPALAISRATRPDQQVLSSTIGELPARLAQAKLPGPVLVMLGQTLESGAATGLKNPAAAARR